MLLGKPIRSPWHPHLVPRPFWPGWWGGNHGSPPTTHLGHTSFSNIHLLGAISGHGSYMISNNNMFADIFRRRPCFQDPPPSRCQSKWKGHIRPYWPDRVKIGPLRYLSGEGSNNPTRVFANIGPGYLRAAIWRFSGFWEPPIVGEYWKNRFGADLQWVSLITVIKVSKMQKWVKSRKFHRTLYNNIDN